MAIDIKSIKLSGKIKAEESCGSVLLSGEGCAELPEFKTIADAVRIKLDYSAVGDAELLLYGINSFGERELFRSDKLLGNDLSYEYDPINLAVYRDMQLFYLCIGLSEGASLTVKELSVSFDNFEDSTDDDDMISEKKYKAPDKMLFIGNSLVFGMQMRYGMCATAPDKDYFHYVSTFVSKINPKCEFFKLHGSGYEHCSDMEMFEKWWSEDPNQYTGRPASESFSEDLDLILIQLGDNVNTDEKEEAFFADCDTFIERIKKASPRARIIWISGWYGRAAVLSRIAELCERWEIERINIKPLRSVENEAHGQKEFLAADGTMQPIKETWITHPGNRGMKAIADRIINHLNIT